MGLHDREWFNESRHKPKNATSDSSGLAESCSSTTWRVLAGRPQGFLAGLTVGLLIS
ncbi:hypothetical protein [Pseudomonas aeruginosa]|uniref:hypothetical protein n=1 Tax=Pseudomonas aeruginosa TaxID=287 RepID=UPI0015BE7B37|nr:hypothetical protein [Pseudomonas aeruginosa]QLF28866.1 hypothetical protein GNT55_17545 [Pseudomonas aeruginosa]